MYLFNLVMDAIVIKVLIQIRIILDQITVGYVMSGKKLVLNGLLVFL